MGKKLTTKQQRFVDLYDGNATEAARRAGYKGNDNTLKSIGSKLLTKVDIKEAIEVREKKSITKKIKTREERQEFWSTAMDDKDIPWKDRLKASELLGKSEGDFINKHEHSGPGGKPIETTQVDVIEIDPSEWSEEELDVLEKIAKKQEERFGKI